MIITGQKALNLVSNHAILKAVPELLGPVEAFAAANRQWQPKKNCPGNCDKSQFFNSVETAALTAFSNLASDAVARLKTFLGQRELYVNVPRPGKSAVVKELK